MELFTELNKKIDTLTQDLSLTEGKHFNYMKILQHGISFGEQKQKDKVNKTYWNLPYPLFLLYLKAKYFSAKQAGRTDKRFHLRKAMDFAVMFSHLF